MGVPPKKPSPSPLRPLTKSLAHDLDRLAFGAPVAYVYNPLVYAWEAHACYLDRFGHGAREVLLVGMNPGPFGMAQCGVPFGDVTMVREFLGIDTAVGKPPREHPKRPVLGFGFPRAEVSGTRFWGWVQARFQTPDRFFERFFVTNYCPLAFMEESGRNRTPDKLPPLEREPLLERCDEALRQLVDALSPRIVIGVGTFARAAALRALDARSVEVAGILHPSPANPRANKDWAAAAEADLKKAGVRLV